MPSVTVLMRYLIALAIGCHGMTYVLCSTQIQVMLRDWMRRSLVLGTALSGDRLEALAVTLWIIAGIGLICAAVAIGLPSLMPGYWRPIATGSSLVGIASFLVIWDGRALGFASEGGVGMIISAMILAGAVGV